MKFRYIFLTFLFLILSLHGFAQEVLTEVNPQEPVMNESFYVTFKIKVSSDTEPYITFTPSGAQVLGKREQGVSIQTVVINGKFTTTKEQEIVYELMADHSGMVTLRNIKVDINGKTIPVKDVHINILSAPKKTPEAFIEAQVSKTKVYVGEGIDVNYYLYFKTSANLENVKDFPKLNKFIKRFHSINSPPETVQYKGEVIRRILAYSARVYPEKVGSAVIDPLRLNIQLVESDYNGFGFGTQRVKTKELASNRVEIEVLPLPSENVPPGFTGLVGEHEFKLIGGKEKYLVNEPIELKLEVSGKGALEKMDSPVIYSDNNLETFDTKSEVTETGNNTAKKVFEYTYLARNALSIKARDLSLAYFDPSTGKYVEKKIKIPEIDVSGTAAPSTGNQKVVDKKNDNPDSSAGDSNFLDNLLNGKSKSVIRPELGLVGPIFKNLSFIEMNYFKMINIFLLLIAIAILVIILKNSEIQINYKGANKEAKNLLSNLKKNGLNYSDLYKLLSMMDKANRISKEGMSLIEIIDSSDLSREAKLYFKNCLNGCEQQNYGVKKSQSPVKFENKFFNELIKHL